MKGEELAAFPRSSRTFLDPLAELPSVNSAEFIKFSECFTDFQLEKQLSLELSWKGATKELETSWKRAGNESWKRAGKESQACRKLVRSGVPQRPNLAGTGLQPGPASCSTFKVVEPTKKWVKCNKKPSYL